MKLPTLPLTFLLTASAAMLQAQASSRHHPSIRHTATTGDAIESRRIYATGQLLTNEDGHDHRTNFLYEIDSVTGQARPVSPPFSGPAGLAQAPDGRLFGYSSGQLSIINPVSGSLTPI